MPKFFENYWSAGLGRWKKRTIGAVNPSEIWRDNKLAECCRNSCRDDGSEPKAAYEDGAGGADDADGKWAVMLEPLVPSRASVVETKPQKHPDQERDAYADDDANAPTIERDMFGFHEFNFECVSSLVQPLMAPGLRPDAFRKV